MRVHVRFLMMVFPFGQALRRSMGEFVRAPGIQLRYVNSVREIVRQADRSLPVTDIKTQAAQIDQTMNQEIIFARLCTVFAIVALLIACVGLYGTMSYTVARRTGEIGIRMALGARRGDVIRMVLRQAFALSAIGLAIGVPVALGASKFVESFLFGVKANDTAALFLAVAILLSAVLVASYVPARTASRIDPLTAVRHE
jgi:ABC-type antimicrobial peptide transport system permease subunit